VTGYITEQEQHESKHTVVLNPQKMDLQVLRIYRNIDNKLQGVVVKTNQHTLCKTKQCYHLL